MNTCEYRERPLNNKNKQINNNDQLQNTVMNPKKDSLLLLNMILKTGYKKH